MSLIKNFKHNSGMMNSLTITAPKSIIMIYVHTELTNSQTLRIIEIGEGLLKEMGAA